MNTVAISAPNTPDTETTLIPLAGEGVERPSRPGAEEAAVQAAAETEADPRENTEERTNELARQLVDDADLRPFVRLQISRDEDSGQFVYTTVDSRSGDVLGQWPREDLLQRVDNPEALDGLMVDRTV